ncbi:MAG TPA: tetratricopeptide repeat protein [Terriglobales bacterium]|nr:tetratricopeptide repeat protein [Terriglobales bacterium]
MSVSSSFAFAQAAPAPGPKPDDPSFKISLETSELLFTTLAAINMCGYDQDLGAADSIRNQVRSELTERFRASSAADTARDLLCQYFKDKQQPDPSRELSQYVSLALHLSGPPDFSLTAKEADLPPDAANLVGFIPLLKQFYETANIHRIWLKHQPEYERQIAKLQQPVSKMIFNTDLYLKMPVSGYLGRKFLVYVEPMGAASQVNARNYGVDYFLVASPSAAALKMDQVRHTYLHFILDPLVQKRANQLKRLDPILALARSAPIEENYKQDAGLMVVESLIKAIEARTLVLPAGTDAKTAQQLRDAAAQSAMEQGYILTRHFYDQLIASEQDPAGLKDVFGPMLLAVDLSRERKRLEGINFVAQAAPDVVAASKSRRPQLLDLAEERLAQRDPDSAHRIAQQVLDQKTGDPARAMFILGRAATLKKDIEGAQLLFERTLEVAREPRMVAWSHIYLGRILDLKCNRESALSHYRAALQAGDASADTRTAAAKGVRDLPPGCEQ